MRFTNIIYAAFAATALAAPAPTPAYPTTCPGLLQDLSPGVKELVTALGLPGVAEALSETLVTLSKDLKKREEVEALEARGPLLADLAPDVALLVTSLGLGALAPGLASLLNGASKGL